MDQARARHGGIDFACRCRLQLHHVPSIDPPKPIDEFSTIDSKSGQVSTKWATSFHAAALDADLPA